jgi:hypothetical protein
VSTIIIINPKVVVSKAATVATNDGSISVVNPDGHICAHGFPSEDFAHGWLYAKTNCHKD